MTALEITDNPIVWQELSHQERSASRLKRLGLVGPVLIGLAIIGVSLTLTQVDFPTRELGIFVIWMVHTLTAVRALNAGANAISREHVGQTWDSLILTGVSARQILFGKWQAVLRRVAPWMLIFGTVRLAMIPIFLIALLNYYAWASQRYTGYSNSNSNYGYDLSPDVSFVPWAAILAVVMSVVLTILEILCCTIIGIAASAVMRNNINARVTALLARFMPVILFASLTRFQLGDDSAYSYVVLRFAPFAMADGGTSSLSRLAVPRTPLSYTTHFDALTGLAASTALIATMLLISLFVAWFAIRRTGALPQAND